MGAAHEEITLITCSGLSNTGRLTGKAALALRHQLPEQIECHLPATCPAGDLEQAAVEGSCLLVLDGCEDCCARKKLRASGLEPDLHLIATRCGIEKNGMAPVRYEEIERFVAAVREVIGG